MHVAVLPTCISVHHMPVWCPQRSQEKDHISSNWNYRYFEPLCKCWESNHDPLEEQQYAQQISPSLRKRLLKSLFLSFILHIILCSLCLHICVYVHMHVYICVGVCGHICVSVCVHVEARDKYFHALSTFIYC